MAVDIALFVVAAAAVWLAGSRIARYAQLVSERTGLGQALIGLVLLGGITSLPELATTLTAALRGNAPLAVNNVLGGVAMQVVVLAVADAVIGKDALSSVVARPNVLLMGVLDVLLLALVAAGIIVGERAVGGVGAWSAAIAVAYAVAIWRVSASRKLESWSATGIDEGAVAREQEPAGAPELGNAALAGRMLLAAAVIFGAGYLLTVKAEALAERTGLGSNFMGVAFLALATSLPEISTATAAVRLRYYTMAFADIFGTNLFDLVLVFVADLAYSGPPVLSEVGTFAAAAALLGIVLTGIFLAGLIERRDRVVLRMGVDALAVIILYIGGMALLFRLR